MRFTLIVPDGTIAIDGVGHQINVSSAPYGLHAVQWYGAWGEEEWSDERGRIVRNQEISSYNDYQWAIYAWDNANAEFQAIIAERQKITQSIVGESGPTVI